VDTCGGKYESVSNEQGYYFALNELTRSPEFSKDKVEVRLFKVGFCRK
jgi:hypothetical protein